MSRPLLAAYALACALVLALAPPAAAQISKLPHADSTAANFGTSTAIDGDLALVGASGADLCGANSGTAYVFERDPATDSWRQAAQLVPSRCVPGSFFGRAVSLSGDRALIAASGEFMSTRMTDAAYIFERDPATGRWEETARLTRDTEAREGSFATAVALDGDRALVTTSGDPAHGQHGGAAYIFERDPATAAWEETARLTGSGGLEAGIFGGSAALYGDRAVVSASTYYDDRPGSVYIFERDPATGRWHEAARFGDIDDFFISVDIHGDRVIVGESKTGSGDSGAATIYTRDASGAWRRTATLRPETPYKFGAFGTAVSLQGDYALVVGFDEQLGLDFNVDRVVYVFRHDPSREAWLQHRIIDIGEVAFGTDVDYDAGLALIGNALDAQAGAAYVVQIH